MRRAPLAFLVSAFSLTALPMTVGCGSSETPAQPAPEDTAVEETEEDTTTPDVPPFEAPPTNEKLLIRRIYWPEGNCYGAPTGIGNYALLPDGGVAPCASGEVCYVRKDGWVAYHNEDCIPAGKFAANWDKTVYSDLGPCEIPKHVDLTIKDCPAKSCVWGRDVTLDTTKGCATTIKTIKCRSDLGVPDSCWCSKTKADLVFVAADPKSTADPGPDFAPCGSANAACKKALSIIDTAPACGSTSTGDGGTD